VRPRASVTAGAGFFRTELLVETRRPSGLSCRSRTTRRAATTAGPGRG
jgi:hypothetical protein